MGGNNDEATTIQECAHATCELLFASNTQRDVERREVLFVLESAILARLELGDQRLGRHPRSDGGSGPHRS